MSGNDCRAPGMTWVSPYLTVRDANKSLEFYEKAFGFIKHMALADDKGKISHGEVKCNDVVIMFGPEGNPGNPAKAPANSGAASPVSLYIYCEDADAQFQRAVAAGAKGDIEPVDMFWGDRMCRVTDPDGHSWTFATHTGKTSPPPT
jgi:PhnB protein